MDMNEIKEIFFQECEEQLAELESGLLKMNDGETDSETVNAVFRAVHSIKGGAGAFGLDDLVAFAHVFETTLDCVRSNKLDPGADVMKVMLKSADVLADLTNAARDGATIEPSRTTGLVKDLEALANGESIGGGHAEAAPVKAAPAKAAPAPAPVAVAPPAAEPTDDSGFQPIPFSFDDFGGEEDVVAGVPTYEVNFKPRSELYAKGNDAALLLRDLHRVGEMSIHCDMSALPAFDELEPESAYFSWKVWIKTDKGEEAIRQVFEFAEWDCELEIKPLEAEEEAAQAANEELPMQPVPFDLAMLDEEPAMTIEVEDHAAEAASLMAAVQAQETAAPDPVSSRNTAAAARAAEKKEAPAAAAAAAAKSGGDAAGGTPTIRVDLDRVDRLINLVGELVINQAMLAQSVIENDQSGTNGINMGLEELQQLTREIQDSVMAIRAQPVKPVFQRMSRIVREVADMVGKSVRLITEGENTEVDKTVIDKLAEPLTHMIRNAVDHGLNRRRSVQPPARIPKAPSS
jgi:two-component system chemotaxis sensor kinase CheA